MRTRAILLTTALSLGIMGSALASGTTTAAGKIKTSTSSAKWILGKQKIQVALLMDTSSSMDGLIEQAKSQLWKIVNELATAEYQGTKPTIEIALYHYGNDGLSKSSNYIKQILPFTTDLDKVSDELFKLSTNGGEEYCGAAVEDATLNLKWSDSNEDLKLIYIAGNESFSQGGVDYKKACRDAIKKGIVVNTIYCGTESEGVNTHWKDGALLADGEFISINMNEATVYIETPYDTTLLRMNQELNSTYIFYGNDGLVAAENQAKQDDNAKKYSKSNAAERTASKAGSGYYNSSWDLVDKSKEKDFDIKKMETKDMPEEMKNMDEGEMVQYIEQKSEKRDSIKTQIVEINKQRQQYIDEEMKKRNTTNSLDQAVVNSVRNIAEKKNYKFVKN